MTAVRVRTPGNLPETRIFCEEVDVMGAGCNRNTSPPTGWDARDARQVAKALGWGRVGGKDYCAAHLPSAYQRRNTRVIPPGVASSAPATESGQA